MGEEAKKGPVSVYTFLTTLSGQGKILLLILLSLGWVGFPGIGIFIGFFIAYLGVRIAMGKNFIWMPKFICRKHIPSSFLAKVIDQILKVLKVMRSWSQPRYQWMTQKTTIRVINGGMATLLGVCLAFSPPIPLIGFVACLAFFLIAIGILNDDFMYLILGYTVSLFYIVMISVLLNYLSFAKIFQFVQQTVIAYKE